MRISLILILIALGFAAHAYASDTPNRFDVDPNEIYETAYTGFGNWANTITTASDPVSLGGGKYRVEYNFSIQNFSNQQQKFALGALTDFAPGINIDSYETQALGGAPAWGRENVQARKAGDEKATDYAHGFIGSIAPGVTYHYRLIVNATITSAAQTSMLDCRTSANMDTKGFTLYPDLNERIPGVTYVQDPNKVQITDAPVPVCSSTIVDPRKQQYADYMAQPYSKYAESKLANQAPGMDYIKPELHIVQDGNNVTTVNIVGFTNQSGVNRYVSMYSYPYPIDHATLKEITAEPLDGAPITNSTNDQIQNPSGTFPLSHYFITGKVTLTDPNSGNNSFFEKAVMIPPGATYRYKITTKYETNSLATATTLDCSTTDAEIKASKNMPTGFWASMTMYVQNASEVNTNRVDLIDSQSICDSGNEIPPVVKTQDNKTVNTTPQTANSPGASSIPTNAPSSAPARPEITSGALPTQLSNSPRLASQPNNAQLGMENNTGQQAQGTQTAQSNQSSIGENALPVAKAGTRDASPKSLLDEVTRDSGSDPFLPSAASKDVVAQGGSSSTSNDDLIGSLGAHNIANSHSTSRNIEYGIAGILMICALMTLATNKKYGRPGMEYVLDPRTQLSPSGSLHAHQSNDGNTNIYNTDMHLVDIEVPAEERELELVGASSISGSAKRSRRIVDPTMDTRQALPTRIWNELVRRLSAEKIRK